MIYNQYICATKRASVEAGENMGRKRRESIRREEDVESPDETDSTEDLLEQIRRLEEEKKWRVRRSVVSKRRAISSISS